MIAALLLAACLAPGCRAPSSSEPGSDAEGDAAPQADAGAPAPVLPAVEDPPSDFSAARAWRHLEALVGIGPRPATSAGSAQARSYLRARLESAGFEVQDLETSFGHKSGEDAPIALPTLTHLIGRLPGAVPDVLLIAAPYSTFAAPSGDLELVGANAAASGPAVALELARALASEARTFSIWVVLIEGDADPDAPLLGSRGLASWLASEGALARIRSAVFLERVGDADLRIARDLYSNRTDRELIWRAARELGHAASFESGGFETPLASHRAFLDAGLRRVVAILDTHYGGAQPPGPWFRSAEDRKSRCSHESLDAVGDVLLASLERIEERLVKIDRFVEEPVASTARNAYERSAASLPATGASSASESEATNGSATSAPLGSESVPRAGDAGGVEASDSNDSSAGSDHPPSGGAATEERSESVPAAASP